MIQKIKARLIKWLGGYTSEELSGSWLQGYGEGFVMARELSRRAARAFLRSRA